MHLGGGNPAVYSMTDHTSGEVVELSLVEEEKDLGIWIASNLKPCLHCFRTAALKSYSNARPALKISQVFI